MPATATAPPPAEVAPPAPTPSTGLSRLGEAPVIDRIDKRRLSLIKSQIAPNASDGEVGHFLELCDHYDLDAFAREAWCVKGKGKDGAEGKLLIMVGRDGLRKIVMRNGLHMDCDYVCENDEFKVIRLPDGNRTVAHSYGLPKERGALVGAWAEVRKGGPKGEPMGFFFAMIGEYRPKNVNSFSPWANQTSVMILAAAERQAARQATPLSGLLVEGEDESIGSTGVELGEDDLPLGFMDELLGDLDPSLRAAVTRMVADWPPAKVEMTFGGLDADGIRAVVADWSEDVTPPSEPERLDEEADEVDRDAPERLDEDASPDAPEDASEDATIVDVVLVEDDQGKLDV